MAKIILNPAIRTLRGRIGDMVFRQVGHQTIMCRRPRPGHRPPTPAQLAHQSRFVRAGAYGRGVCSDPARAACYEAIARTRRVAIYRLAMTDWLSAPVIDQIDLQAFNGHRGDVIGIDAHDDTKVVSVEVVLRRGGGAILEQGLATHDGVFWLYTVAGDLPPDEVITVQVNARDLAGNETTDRRIITPPVESPSVL